jgi:HNH endonuclease
MVTGKIKTRRLIENFPSYEIDMDGSIYSLNLMHFESGVCYQVKPRRDRAGYLTVRLTAYGHTHTKYVHRLLAENFLQPIVEKPFVNHINGIKTDNRLSNLEYCTHQENVKEAYRQGLNSTAKKVIDTLTGIIYPSISQAAICLGLKINTCCKRLQRGDNSFRLKYIR